MDCLATSFSVSITPFAGMEGSIDHMRPRPMPSASVAVTASRPGTLRSRSSTDSTPLALWEQVQAAAMSDTGVAGGQRPHDGPVG